MNLTRERMEKYLTAKEVADKVQLAEQTIRRYVMKKQIPFYKIYRSVRFKPCEIEKWIEQRKSNVRMSNEKLAMSNGKRAKGKNELFSSLEGINND